jgi:hypothetical protein
MLILQPFFYCSRIWENKSSMMAAEMKFISQITKCAPNTIWQARINFGWTKDEICVNPNSGITEWYAHHFNRMQGAKLIMKYQPKQKTKNDYSKDY